MPQMAPINWLMTIFFSSCILSFLIFSTHYQQYPNFSSFSYKISSTSPMWKW
uniref:ATP synthase complex subunit 8 n=1 Tax=Phrynus sp. 1 SEM-2008 TaxID=507471 RepID=B2CKD6_9ARAC|nr:ATP synthase subunit 8 [Phrynus sp. 1 SEM-2008]